ncbi:MAG: L-lactate dehydrogenase [Pelotomaculaceae bacterium]|jgi:L-lactate dehydrogenase|nr:L-lactate dehydrogenase [Bacillota bacterium]HHU85927.1 L-lactate dehydrogenase [Peptococcaceae bacterium]
MPKGKIAVVGVGAVGATTAFTLAMSGLATELVLVDVNQPKAIGEALDIAHAAAFIKPARIYAGTFEDCRDASIIVFSAGAAQKPGETRLELLQKNYAILKQSLPRLQGGNQEQILIIVSNPVDVLTYAALKITGLPPQKVFGSGTVLDSSRFRHSLSRRCGVAPRNIHAYVVGEHGDSEVLLWSLAYIAGMRVDQYCDLACIEPVSRRVLEQEVKNAAHEIILGKGATYYAISLAVKRICESIARDENSILTVTGLIDGLYGIKDCCLSLPAVINAGGRGRPLELPLAEEERKALLESAAIIKNAINELGL